MALFEAIRERQRRNLVRKDDPRSLALRKRQGFDLSERQIGERLLRASPNAVKVMTIEHHLENVILDDLHAAFVVIGKNGLSPIACPRNEPQRESPGAGAREEQASEQGVHQLCPRNLHVRDIGNIAHVGWIDATVTKRDVGALHFVEANEVPGCRERLGAEHLELIIIENECQFDPGECGQQTEPDEQGHARAAPPHRELMPYELRTAGEVARVAIGFAVT
ncbi:hypothetical protein [Sphingopyxis fribergensis]|uniref:hypothetical protein n=1 Tax=Sphingopyxis fribergensis TaxID=1515612 RepID=UPI001E43648F|nr:hypothetical protein [Sphingopyxis fribergensis]